MDEENCVSAAAAMVYFKKTLILLGPLADPRSKKNQDVILSRTFVQYPLLTSSTLHLIIFYCDIVNLQSKRAFFSFMRVVPSKLALQSTRKLQEMLSAALA